MEDAERVFQELRFSEYQAQSLNEIQTPSVTKPPDLMYPVSVSKHIRNHPRTPVVTLDPDRIVFSQKEMHQFHVYNHIAHPTHRL